VGTVASLRMPSQNSKRQPLGGLFFPFQGSLANEYFRLNCDHFAELIQSTHERIDATIEM
jgi:hypothetical protein